MTEVIRPDSVVVTATDHLLYHSNQGVSTKDAIAFSSNAAAQRSAFTDRGVVDMSNLAAQRAAVTDRAICDLNQQMLLQGQSQSAAMAQMALNFSERLCSVTLEAQKNTAEIMRAAQECCCETKAAIVEQGNSTRELIQRNLIEDLRFRLARALPTPAPPL